MKSLDLWLLAINRYERKTRSLSPFEGTYEGFVQCMQQPENEPNVTLLGLFSAEAYSRASSEWTRRQQMSWLLALVETESFEQFPATEEGCLLARKLMLEATGELREKAVAAWTSFTKMMMKE